MTNDWPPQLGKRDERLRAAHGLVPKKDGWYKWLDGKVRYVCKRLPLADAIEHLSARMRALPPIEHSPLRRINLSTLTVKELANLFLADCWERVRTGKPKKMSRVTYDDYEAVLARFCEVVGVDRLVSQLGPADFNRFVDTLRRRAGTSMRREMIYVDRLFNWAGPGKRGMNLIPEIRRGPNWIHPPGVGEKDKAYTFKQLRESFATVQSKPFLLAAWHLGFGSGFILSDLGALREDQVDLDAGVIQFPTGRGKTGMDRLCALHPLGVAALREYLRTRPAKCDDSARGLFFRTTQGTPIAKLYEGEARSYAANALKRPWRNRVGLPYTGLRTTLASLLDDWTDQRAVDVILGHKSTERAKHIRTVHYAKQFNPERALRAVEHLYAQVFGQSDPRLASSPPPVSRRRPVRVRRAGTRANAASRHGESGIAEAARRERVHRSRAARRPG